MKSLRAGTNKVEVSVVIEQIGIAHGVGGNACACNAETFFILKNALESYLYPLCCYVLS